MDQGKVRHHGEFACEACDEAAERTISRRNLARSAGMLAGGLAAVSTLGTVVAQSASPEASPEAEAAASPVADVPADPDATFERISSSREDVMAQMRETHEFEEPEQTGGDVIQVFTSDITMLNPMMAQDLASSYITGLVYQSLIGVNPVDGSYIPRIADWWELGSDGVRYRFHLNPDAAWHDGTPLTADDVIYSLDIILDPDGLAPSQGTVDRALASYEKVDDHTVELVSRKPSSTFLQDTAVTLDIMPKHIWESVPAADWNADPGSTGQDPSRVIGSGAFVFDEWVPGDHITVSRNDNYWLPDEIPVIDRYIYRVVPESSSALQSLQTGESDISSITPALAPSFIESNPNFNVHEYNRAHITYIETNMDEEKCQFFLDVRVRQAMMYAMDRDLIAQAIFQGYAVRADGPQPPLSPGYAPDQITTIYLQDVEKANALLDEAGWVMGDSGLREKDGVPFSFDFTYEEDSATYAQLIPYVQQAWAEVGLEMKPHAMPFPAQQEELNKRNYDAALTGITLNTTGNQGILFRCDSIYPSGYNEVKYCNPEYDKLDDAQRQELDPEKRRDLLIEAANIIAYDVPVEPIVFVSGLVASSPRVHNYFPSGYSSLWSINWTWVEQ